MSKRAKIVVDVSNLSIHATKFIRTGIQEVVYKTLMSLVNLRSEFPSIELTLLPQLPRRFGNMLSSTTTVPYQNPATFILEEIERELNLPSSEIWGYDLKGKNYELSDEESFQKIVEADALHIQSMVNVGPLMQALEAAKSPAFHRLSMTVYDLVPVLFPEYCDHGLARWFQGVYVPSISDYVHHAVCISRHTAMDLKANPLTQKIPKVSALPLPFDLSSHVQKTTEVLHQLHLSQQDYLVFLGSLEPRKNFEALLDGFQTFKRMNPTAKTKLVLVGATGWKNFHVEQRMKTPWVQENVIRAGYLSDSELGDLIQNALALVMVSHYEGFGLPVAQAFSRGVPVITTLGSSLPEACGGEAVFVEPNDPWSVCAGIQQVLSGSKPCFSPSRIQEWTWNGYARELLKLIIQDLSPGA